jgi:hypothetical protein
MKWVHIAFMTVILLGLWCLGLILVIACPIAVFHVWKFFLLEESL